MFGLIESGTTHARKPMASVLSVAIHATMITAAALATQQVSTVVQAVTPELVRYVEPAPRAQSAPLTPAVALLSRGFQILIAPVSIPDVLPAIDPTLTATNPDAFTGNGVVGGVPDGAVGAPPPGGTFTEEQVERVARLVAGTGTPQYPQALRSAGIEGGVDVEFVIDTAGRADLPTIRVVSSTHQHFTDAALKALAKARFAPAELNGRKVRQRVRMPFVFAIKGPVS